MKTPPSGRASTIRATSLDARQATFRPHSPPGARASRVPKQPANHLPEVSTVLYGSPGEPALTEVGTNADRKALSVCNRHDGLDRASRVAGVYDIEAVVAKAQVQSPSTFTPVRIERSSFVRRPAVLRMAYQVGAAMGGRRPDPRGQESGSEIPNLRRASQTAAPARLSTPTLSRMFDT